MAQWLSWLERRPVTAEVESSSLFWVVFWDLSSAGRASALQAEGHRFEPCRSHMDGFPSGQRGQTVNLLRHASMVRIHLHPFFLSENGRPAAVAELADAQDLKSCGTNLSCRFDSGLRHLKSFGFPGLFCLRVVFRVA